MPARVLVIGSGIFGVSAALELAGRGARVTLVDAGPIPHPLAASTDISKIVRADYGADVFYTELMEHALERWNDLDQSFDAPTYHPTGFVILSSEPMATGSFELDSFETLSSRGHAVERLDASAIAARFPAWRPGRFVDGYFNPRGGWVESGRVVAAFAKRARAAGVDVVESVTVERLLERDGRVSGAVVAGAELEADLVIVATGTWITTLVPDLADRIVSVAQPVMHFAPLDADRFRPPAFVPWAADISRTGWYGFSANPDGIVKIANHGPGHALDPSGTRPFPPDAEARFRAFIADSLPALVGVRESLRRLCFYADSFDGDFLIAHHPERRGLVVASGGSGHAFKFAPVLGEIIADVALERPTHWAERFRWRARGDRRTEAARFDG